MPRLSNAARVLLALGLGAVSGLLLAYTDPALGVRAADLVQPVGRLWLNALQMTVVPLVAALVILGVNAATDAAASGRTARRAMAVFAVLLIASGTFTAFMAPGLLSLVPRDPALVEGFRLAIGADETVIGRAPSFGEWITTVIPSNALAAAAANAMLPLVVFSLFFGFAVTRIDPERRARLLELVQSIADTMIVVVRWVLLAAPIGVVALVLAVCARVGLAVLGALGWYVLLLCTLYIMVTVMLYGVARVAAKEPVRRFLVGIFPAQVIAGSTQSSLASLPAMIDCARSRLGYPLHVTALVLPMAVSLFRITSPVQYIGVVSFISWMYGIELGGVLIGTAIILSALISMGSVGLPGQVSFMTNNLPVTQAMGLPVEPLGLLLAVDNIPDMFSTVGNVSADLTATAIVNHLEASGESGASAT